MCSRVSCRCSETLVRLEILMDRVYQLGLAAGMQCRRSLAGGALRRRVPLPAGLREPGRAARHTVACHPDARALRAEQLRPRVQCFTNMLMLYWRSRSVPQLSTLPHHMRGTLK